MVCRVSAEVFVEEVDGFGSDVTFSAGWVEEAGESTLAILDASIDSSDRVTSAMKELVSSDGGFGFAGAGFACEGFGGEGMIEEGFVGAGLASMRRMLVTVEVYTGDTSESSVLICDGSFAMGSS